MASSVKSSNALLLKAQTTQVNREEVLVLSLIDAPTNPRRTQDDQGAMPPPEGRTSPCPELS